MKLGVAHSRRLNSIMSKMNTREVQGQCDLDNNPILKFLHDRSIFEFPTNIHFVPLLERPTIVPVLSVKLIQYFKIGL